MKARVPLPAFVALFRPLASMCVRRGLRLNDAIECLKAAFVQAALLEGEREEQKPTVTEIHTMTGVHRADVRRLLDTNCSQLDPVLDVTSKVLGRWQTEKKYLTPGGAPRPLSCEGDRCEFARLVGAVSKDLRYKPILAELRRSGAVEVRDTLAYVASPSFTPTADLEQNLKVLGVDVAALIRSGEENILDQCIPRHLQSRTDFDRIRAEHRDEIAHWLLKRGHQLHQEAREYLAQFDQDIHPVPKYSGSFIRVILGAFSYLGDKKP